MFIAHLLYFKRYTHNSGTRIWNGIKIVYAIIHNNDNKDPKKKTQQILQRFLLVKAIPIKFFLQQKLNSQKHVGSKISPIINVKTIIIL